MNFSNQTALITGATGELGFEVVKKFLDAGAHVFALGRNPEKLKSLLQLDKSKNKLDLVTADVTNLDEMDTVFTGILKKKNKIDMLINIAGGFKAGKSIADTRLDEWNFMMDLNLKSVFISSKMVMGVMAEQKRGKIVTVSALAALAAKPKRAAYMVSKAGVIALTQALAVEGKEINVQANTIAPGIIMTKANMEAMPDADFSKWVPPARIAETMLYLCSPEADDITGTIIQMPGSL